MYLASLVVRRDPTTVAADAGEVEAGLAAVLASPPPEHHRIRHQRDALTLVCFVSAGSEREAHLLIGQLRQRVSATVAGYAGWSLDESPEPPA